MIERLDAVVALANDSGEQSTIGDVTIKRLNKAVDLVKAGVAPHLVVAGAYSFMRLLPFVGKTPPDSPIAELMKDYAIDLGISEHQILSQAHSLDTIGDALLTKKMVTEPNGWRNLLVVTSTDHLPRSLHVFEHVMGPEYDIQGVSTDEPPSKHSSSYELMGDLLMRAVLHGTEAGDTDAIEARLFGIIPGYTDVSAPRRLLNFGRAIAA